MTYGELYNDHVYYNTMMEPALRRLLKGRINDFYKENEVRLSTISEKRDKLQREWLQFEDDKPKFGGEKGKEQVLMIEGKLLEDYKKAYQDLMQTEINGVRNVSKVKV